MSDHKTINEMFERFQTILNGLGALDKDFTIEENNILLLDNLSKEQEPKSISILELWRWVTCSDFLRFADSI